LSVTFQLHITSYSIGFKLSSYFVGIFLNKLLTIKLGSNHSGTNNPDILEVGVNFKSLGCFHVSFSFHFRANSMNCFQIGAAQFNQSQFALIAFQFVFHTQTTVVI
jgi:hypothetical protein